MPQGQLKAWVTTAHQAFPVEGAYMLVTSREDPPRLLAWRRTDISGNTSTVWLDTPERGASLAPGTAQPFLQVDVTLYAPGYYRAELKGVQVFEGEVTLQKEDLIPLPEFISSGERVVTITPQNL